MGVRTGRTQPAHQCQIAQEDAWRIARRWTCSNTGADRIFGDCGLKLGARHVLGAGHDPMRSAPRWRTPRVTVLPSASARRTAPGELQEPPRAFRSGVGQHFGEGEYHAVRSGLGARGAPRRPRPVQGILEEQADEVEAALRRTGLEPTGRRTQGDWVVIEARKPQA
jgi:hypothetical protein